MSSTCPPPTKCARAHCKRGPFISAGNRAESERALGERGAALPPPRRTALRERERWGSEAVRAIIKWDRTSRRDGRLNKFSTLSIACLAQARRQATYRSFL